jgi:hypothetical protein
VIKACMGGWCRAREHCRNYHAALNLRPSERLCEPGRDGYSEDYAVVLHRPAYAVASGQSSGERAEQPVSWLSPVQTADDRRAA